VFCGSYIAMLIPLHRGLCKTHPCARWLFFRNSLFVQCGLCLTTCLPLHRNPSSCKLPHTAPPSPSTFPDADARRAENASKHSWPTSAQNRTRRRTRCVVLDPNPRGASLTIARAQARRDPVADARAAATGGGRGCIAAAAAATMACVRARRALEDGTSARRAEGVGREVYDTAHDTRNEPA
jgi:hypothetical protein